MNRHVSVERYPAKFKHKTRGTIYTLVGRSNTLATRAGWRVDAVYLDSNNQLWTRPWGEFMAAVEEVSDDQNMER